MLWQVCLACTSEVSAALARIHDYPRSLIQQAVIMMTVQIMPKGCGNVVSFSQFNGLCSAMAHFFHSSMLSIRGKEHELRHGDYSQEGHCRCKEVLVEG